MAGAIGKLRQLNTMAGQFTARCSWSPGWKSPSARQGAKRRTQGPCPQGSFSSLERTSRPQLYFSSRPRKAAEPGGQSQKNPCPVIDQSLETTTLKGRTWRTDNYSTESSPETSPTIPTCRRALEDSKDPEWVLSLWGAAHAMPFPSFFPHFFLLGHMSLKLYGNGQLATCPGLIP